MTTQIGNNTYYFGDLEFVGTTPTIYHADGRIVSLGGGTWEYHYYVKDHLGNTRVVVKGPSATPTLMQEYHYYPFGMRMEGTWVSPTGTTEKYRYNGKEFVMNGLNMYDYGARWFDPCIGRFIQIDPLADTFSMVSPFAYVSNNPINLIDPDGREIMIGTHIWTPKAIYEGDDEFERKVFDALNSLYETIEAGNVETIEAKGNIIMDFVGNSSKHVTITEGPTWGDYHQTNEDGTGITFSPDVGLTIGKDPENLNTPGEQSPATALAHEFAHA